MNHRKKKERESSRVWVKIFAFLVLTAFFVAGYFIFKETNKKYRIRKEVEELKAEAKELEQGNQKLKGMIEYYKSIGFSEKEAREKMNVKKEGEKVVMLRIEEVEVKNEKTDPTLESKQEYNTYENVSNARKWWDYFFKERTSP